MSDSDDDTDVVIEGAVPDTTASGKSVLPDDKLLAPREPQVLRRMLAKKPNRDKTVVVCSYRGHFRLDPHYLNLRLMDAKFPPTSNIAMVNVAPSKGGNLPGMSRQAVATDEEWRGSYFGRVDSMSSVVRKSMNQHLRNADVSRIAAALLKLRSGESHTKGAQKFLKALSLPMFPRSEVPGETYDSTMIPIKPKYIWRGIGVGSVKAVIMAVMEVNRVEGGMFCGDDMMAYDQLRQWNPLFLSLSDDIKVLEFQREYLFGTDFMHLSQELFGDPPEQPAGTTNHLPRQGEDRNPHAVRQEPSAGYDNHDYAVHQKKRRLHDMSEEEYAWKKRGCLCQWDVGPLQYETNKDVEQAFLGLLSEEDTAKWLLEWPGFGADGTGEELSG